MGYSDFREPQGQVIESLLNQKDTLVILPTGMGKSLCFQLPALMQEGLTLVISPLVSLMENQVQDLVARNLPAARLHSQQSRQQRKQVLELLKRNQLKLLYLSPETLLSQPIWALMLDASVKIQSIVIDEAHCLVQWGTTFRPIYRRLGAARQSIQRVKQQSVTLGAFTATADPQTQREISSVLSLRNHQTFRVSPYRQNLDLKVVRVFTPRGRRNKLLHFIELQGRTSGLVYTRSRKDR
ncbi:MAG: ATP-dependent DNA helicase RecQ [Acaryochloridaceae cyanobacterium RL_2_7]|nr:ATP-dependent DNA helicase RecQ [Acaryochloridaceae cyanobacterium RL_2_7]